MRVIGGELRSRRLKSLPGMKTRPTPDRLRETLFNVLGSRVQGCVFVDAYAGTGAVGIEALSRGAARAVFLENSRTALNVIRENLRGLDLHSRADVIAGPVLRNLAPYARGMVFLDPPYEREREYHDAFRLLAEHPPDLAIAQHSVRFLPDENYGSLQRDRIIRQGDNALSFYSSVGCQSR